MGKFIDGEIMECDTVSTDSDVFIPSRRQRRLGITRSRHDTPLRFKIIMYGKDGSKTTTVYDDFSGEVLYVY